MNKRFELHAIQYQHEGKTWVLEIPATSEADAVQRIEMLQYGTYLGEVKAAVPASLGFVAKTVCWGQRLLRTGGRTV